MHRIIYIIIPFLMMSCKSDANMAMERGIQHYKWNQIDEAIIEFNKVKYLLDFKDGESLESAELLAQAHYNLGISYAKKELFNQAEQEILTAISIIPNPEYRNVLQMVRQQIKDEVDK